MIEVATPPVAAPSPVVVDEQTRDVLRKAKGMVARGWYRLTDDETERVGEKPQMCVLDALGNAQQPGAPARYQGPAHTLLCAIAGTPYLALWNDEPGRTQAEVVALFDKALGA
jgi:hypothetical protein